MDEMYLTQEDVMRRLRIGRGTFEALVQSGKLRTIDLSPPGAQRRSLRVTEGDLQRFIAAREVRPDSGTVDSVT